MDMTGAEIKTVLEEAVDYASSQMAYWCLSLCSWFALAYRGGGAAWAASAAMEFGVETIGRGLRWIWIRRTALSLTIILRQAVMAI